MKTNYKEQAQLLANYLPSGKFWESKNIEESDLRKLLNAFGKEFVNIDDTLKWLKRETNILTTFDLIEFWEDAYGIPDEEGVFITINKSIQERRFNLYLKELMNGADRIKDWEYIAEQFGFNVKVRPCTKTTIQAEKPRYAIVVEFLDFRPSQEFMMYFPIYFSNVDISLLKKIFNIIKPANCDIIYI